MSPICNSSGDTEEWMWGDSEDTVKKIYSRGDSEDLENKTQREQAAGSHESNIRSSLEEFTSNPKTFAMIRQMMVLNIDHNATNKSLCPIPEAAHPLAIILNDVSSAYGVGRILQTAEVASCAVVTCGRTPRPPNHDVLQAAAGAAEVVPQQHYASVADAIAAYKANGYTVWTTTRKHASAATMANAVHYGEQPVPSKLAIVMGSEDSMPSFESLVFADALVYAELQTTEGPSKANAFSTDVAAYKIVSGVLRHAPWCKLDTKQLPSTTEYLENEIALRPDDAAGAWENLGVYDGGAVDGKHYNAKECFQKVLALDPKRAKSWYNLACNGGGTVDVNQQSLKYSPKQCVQNSLALDPQSEDAWHDLGYRLDRNTLAAVDGKHYSKAQAFEKVVSLRPDYPAGWKNLASVVDNVDTATVDGKTYNPRECLQRALAIAPAWAQLWLDLCIAGGGLFHERVYNKFECAKKCLNLDPTYKNCLALEGHFGEPFMLDRAEDRLHYRRMDWLSHVIVLISSGMALAGFRFVRAFLATVEEPLLAS